MRAELASVPSVPAGLVKNWHYHLLTDIAVTQILALLALRNDAYSASAPEFLTESSWPDLPPAPAKKTPTADLYTYNYR